MLDPHRLAELRSLAYHRAVVERARRDPEVIDRARARVETWIAAGHVVPYARRWARVLDGPRDRLFRMLQADDDESRAMRQATPFAGVVPFRERWALWRQVREQLES